MKYEALSKVEKFELALHDFRKTLAHAGIPYQLVAAINDGNGSVVGGVSEGLPPNQQVEFLNAIDGHALMLMQGLLKSDA